MHDSNNDTQIVHVKYIHIYVKFNKYKNLFCSCSKSNHKNKSYWIMKKIYTTIVDMYNS